jgi:membrane protein YqaA with SNARE-associated domain
LNDQPTKSRSLRQKLRDLWIRLETYADRPWYPTLLGVLAGIDLLVIIIPTDGIFISSVLLQPKKWVRFAVGTAIGSTVGSAVLALVLQHQGTDLINRMFPNLGTSTFWMQVSELIATWGAPILVGLAASPMAMQPSVALCVIAGMPLTTVIVASITGRLIKFLTLGYVSARAPHLLKKLPWVKAALEEHEGPGGATRP